MKIVASLTTMPDKYHKLFDTLKSLKSQTYPLDVIYLSLPTKCRRLNIPYPPLPENIKKLCNVVKCYDYGPITKIAGGLIEEKDPDTIILTFDDDMIYPPNLVESLVNYHNQYPVSAIGSSGMLLKYKCPMCAITPNENFFLYRIPKFNIPKTGRNVDSIFGYPGALYVRKFFPPLEKLHTEFLSLSLIDFNLFMNDDIVISGYLSTKNINRKIFSDVATVSFVSDDLGKRDRNSSEISYNLDIFFQRMNLAIDKCKSLNMYQKTEPMNFDESIAMISIFIILILILILISAYLYYKTGVR